MIIYYNIISKSYICLSFWDMLHGCAPHVQVVTTSLEAYTMRDKIKKNATDIRIDYTVVELITIST